MLRYKDLVYMFMHKFDIFSTKVSEINGLCQVNMMGWYLKVNADTSRGSNSLIFIFASLLYGNQLLKGRICFT